MYAYDYTDVKICIGVFGVGIAEGEQIGTEEKKKRMGDKLL